ncbi:MAG: FISUMP domain-containing protein [Bacteroidales bacterium]|nr:FISUMP domain-containing protein [Bacteroidales bacterium]
MKKIIYIIPFLATVLITNVTGQVALTLTFTGNNNNVYKQLSGVKVKNLTKGVDTILNFPDTVLVLNVAGVNAERHFLHGFSVIQNYPNPVYDQTRFKISIPERDNVHITVTDILGQELIHSEKILGQGVHSFLFMPAAGGKIFLVNISWKGETRTIKVLNEGQGRIGQCILEYQGWENMVSQIKSVPALPGFWFSLGDELMLIGYTDDLESGFADTPLADKDYVFQLATNVPCPGIPTVTYEGQTYNTIQVFSQCWLKENLNVGIKINAPQSQLDNNIIEKYCLVNDPAECARYGGLYMWEELMQYTMEEGTQGICPPGWHVPSDVDWQVLEGAVDSGYGIGDPIWTMTGERGMDVGSNLKSTSGWYSGGNGIDLFGMTVISGGYYYVGGGWAGGSLFATFYTSSHTDTGTTTKPFSRGLSWMWTYTSKDYDLKVHARPVRCLLN